MTDSAVVVTSIPPRMQRYVRDKDVGLDYLRGCVASWRSAGFDVVTLNGEHEIEIVAAMDLPVRIVPVAGSGAPPIGALVAAAKRTSARLCGIVNADCAFTLLPNLCERLGELSSDAILMCERIDIDRRTEQPLARTLGGFDAFFFDPASLDPGQLGPAPDAFRLGDPWWDYWFPCAAMGQGRRVRRLMMPVLTHLDHDRIADRERFRARGRALAHDIVRLAQNSDADPKLVRLAASLPAYAGEDLAGLGRAIVRTLWADDGEGAACYSSPPLDVAERKADALQRAYRSGGLVADSGPPTSNIVGDIVHTIRGANRRRVLRRRATQALTL